MRKLTMIRRKVAVFLTTVFMIVTFAFSTPAFGLATTSGHSTPVQYKPTGICLPTPC